MKSKMELDAEEACKAFPCLVFKKHDQIGILEGKLISAEDMKSLYLTKKDVIGKDDILEVIVGIPKLRIIKESLFIIKLTIIANRYDSCLNDVENKAYTRDLFRRD